MVTGPMTTPALPGDLLARLRPACPGTSLSLEHLEDNHRFHRFRFRFRTGDDRHPEVTGEYLQTLGAGPGEPAPLLQISPILGGALNDYLATRVFAGWAGDAGFSAFFLYQDEEILQPELDAAGIAELMSRTTRENIQALHLLAALPEVDGERLGCFGISLGAIKNVPLLAAEPRLKGGILCLAGGNLPEIFALSRENLVLRYLRKREVEYGKSQSETVEDLRRHVDRDPLRLARFVGPERVLLFLGSLDDKVPYRLGLALYHALGRPELYVLPFGHYTGMIAAPFAADEGFRWMGGRWSADSRESTVRLPEPLAPGGASASGASAWPGGS